MQSEETKSNCKCPFCGSTWGGEFAQKLNEHVDRDHMRSYGTAETYGCICCAYKTLEKEELDAHFKGEAHASRAASFLKVAIDNPVIASRLMVGGRCVA